MKIIKPGKFDYEWTDSKREEFDKENKKVIGEKLSPEILFYGDSITACWNLEKITKNFRATLNRAIGGDRTRYMLYRVDADCIQFFPKRVVFLGGINDLRAWSKKEDYFSNMDEEDIVNEILDNIFSIERKCSSNEIEFMFSSILPIDEEGMDNDLINLKIEEINEILKKYCNDNKLIYIDYYSLVVKEKSNKIIKELTTDGLHPNETGYEIMERILSAKLGGKNEI